MDPVQSWIEILCDEMGPLRGEGTTPWSGDFHAKKRSCLQIGGFCVLRRTSSFTGHQLQVHVTAMLLFSFTARRRRVRTIRDQVGNLQHV